MSLDIVGGSGPGPEYRWRAGQRRLAQGPTGSLARRAPLRLSAVDLVRLRHSYHTVNGRKGPRLDSTRASDVGTERSESIAIS